MVTNSFGALLSSNAVLTMDSVSALVLTPVGFVGGGFQLSVTGPVFTTVIIEGTPDVAAPSWSALYTNNTGASGSFTFTDSDALGLARRFYRARE